MAGSAQTLLLSTTVNNTYGPPPLYLDPNTYSGSGSTWTDSSINGYNTTLVGLGSSQWAYEYGRYWTLNGATAQYVDTNRNLAANEFTISIWFRTSSTGTGMLVSNVLPNNQYNYSLYYSNGKLWGSIYNASGQANVTTNALPTMYNNNTWYLVTFTRQAGTMKLYVNTTEVVSSAEFTTGNITTNQEVWIGRATYQVDQGYQVVGDIGHVWIYDRVLSQAEIQQNYLNTVNNYFPSGNLQILVVAGGGYGGGIDGSGTYSRYTAGGGAGGGGAVTGNIGYATGNYTVTVGGAWSNSVFGNYTAVRGGQGFFSTTSGYCSNDYGSDYGEGGSGGGGAYNITAGCQAYGNAIAGQGYAGGAGVTGLYAGGGGGGAGEPGYTAGQSGHNSSGGNGGNGIVSNISGVSTYYAGGGGGGKGYDTSGTAGTGGNGGGANGGQNCSAGANGGINTGGGGGGAGGSYYCPSYGANGGTGGSGIVIIKYPDTNPAAITTGSPTVNVTGGYRIYTFTGSGTIQLV